MCPWTFVKNEDRKRYPKILVQAKAATPRCHGGLRNCEDVFYYIRVLRRRDECDEENHYVYEAGWQKVTVASVCTKFQLG